MKSPYHWGDIVTRHLMSTSKITNARNELHLVILLPKEVPDGIARPPANITEYFQAYCLLSISWYKGSIMKDTTTMEKSRWYKTRSYRPGSLVLECMLHANRIRRLSERHSEMKWSEERRILSTWKKIPRKQVLWTQFPPNTEFVLECVSMLLPGVYGGKLTLDHSLQQAIVIYLNASKEKQFLSYEVCPGVWMLYSWVSSWTSEYKMSDALNKHDNGMRLPYSSVWVSSLPGPIAARAVNRE